MYSHRHSQPNTHRYAFARFFFSLFFSQFACTFYEIAQNRNAWETKKKKRFCSAVLQCTACRHKFVRQEFILPISNIVNLIINQIVFFFKY